MGNSYQNKKRKRNLVKKANKKGLLSDRLLTKLTMSIEYKKLFDIMFEERLLFGVIPKAVDNLPKDILTEEQLEILTKRATN